MAFPLAPLMPFLLRFGVAAAAGYAASRIFAHGTAPARRDQRLEDALDDLEEGLALRSSVIGAVEADGEAAGGEGRDHAATFRLRRGIGFGGGLWDVDAAFAARLRLRRRSRNDGHP